jgi:hypothetical protein
VDLPLRHIQIDAVERDDITEALGDPAARTSPSTTVYAAIDSPVANAAPIAAQLGRRPRMPHRATPVRPAQDRAIPAAAHPSGTSCAKTAARTVTTRGAVPRAIG